MKKFSLWTLEHESIYNVIAHKVKDTNSVKEVDKWISLNWLNAASFYRIEEQINADYLQTFEEN